MTINSPVASADIAPSATGIRRSAMLPVLATVAVAVAWGIAVSVVDVTADRLPAADLVVWRFGVAAVALLPIRSRAPKCLRRCGFGGLRWVLCSALVSCCRPGQSPTPTQ